MWGHRQLSQCAGPLGNLWGHPEFRTKAAAQGQLPALPPARQRNSHGIIKVGRDSHDHQVQPSTPATPKPSPSARSGRLLNSSTSLGDLLQCLTSQTVNVFFYNIYSESALVTFRPFPRFHSLRARQKGPAPPSPQPP